MSWSKMPSPHEIAWMHACRGACTANMLLMTRSRLHACHMGAHRVQKQLGHELV